MDKSLLWKDSGNLFVFIGRLLGYPGRISVLYFLVGAPGIWRNGKRHRKAGRGIGLLDSGGSVGGQRFLEGVLEV